MTTDMERLVRLTNELPELESMVQSFGCNVVEYEVEGTCIGWGLYKGQGVAVQRAFLSAGTKFPRHAHHEHEHLIVYTGRVEVYMPAGTVIGPGESAHIPPDVAHCVEALEDTWLIGVTVPEGEGYPDAG